MRGFKFPIAIKTNIPLIIIFISIIFLAYSFPNRVTIDLFFILFLAIVLDFIHFLFSLKQLEIMFEDEKKLIQKGEKTTKILGLRNKSCFPIAYVHLEFYKGIRVCLKGAEEARVFLSTYDKVSIKTEYVGELCGRDQVGVKAIYFVDYLSLFKKEYKFWHKEYVEVMPDIKTWKGINTFSQGVEAIQEEIRNENTKQSLLEQGEIGYELDNYRPGDSPRLLHWKIVAQKEMYLVRKREEELAVSMQLLIILNPFIRGYQNLEDKYKAQDRVVCMYLSLASELLKSGQRVALIIFKGHKWERYELNKAYDLKVLCKQLASYEMLFEHTEEEIHKAFIMLGRLRREAGLRLMMSEYWDSELRRGIEKHKNNHSPKQVIVTGTMWEENKNDLKGKGYWLTEQDELVRL